MFLIGELNIEFSEFFWIPKLKKTTRLIWDEIFSHVGFATPFGRIFTDRWKKPREVLWLAASHRWSQIGLWSWKSLSSRCYGHNWRKLKTVLFFLVVVAKWLVLNLVEDGMLGKLFFLVYCVVGWRCVNEKNSRNIAMEEPMFQEYFARKNSGVWSLYYVRLLGAFVLMCGSTVYSSCFGIKLSNKAKVKLDHQQTYQQTCTFPGGNLSFQWVQKP